MGLYLRARLTEKPALTGLGKDAVRMPQTCRQEK